MNGPIDGRGQEVQKTHAMFLNVSTNLIFFIRLRHVRESF